MSRQELCFGKKQETKSKNRRSTRSLKMKKHEHIVKSLMPGGIGEELGIEPGDKLLAINGNEIQDVFDYYYYEESEQLLLLIEKPDGEEWELEIEKDEDESLGIEFDQSLMDEYRSCRNKCMFCFIDQMPKGMRETLYFKDDDSRLSFLQGNYITLTNMSDHDVERIVKYRLEPINISFQTTNPELRCKMLHNRFAGEALKKVDILYRGQIEMNGQIVLCKGVNDGEELERTIRDLTGYLPYLKSVSIVPVGLTKYRDGLYPLEPFTKEDAREVLSVIHRWQEKIYQEHGIHMIHAGDEWYVLAEEEVPEEERYAGERCGNDASVVQRSTGGALCSDRRWKAAGDFSGYGTSDVSLYRKNSGGDQKEIPEYHHTFICDPQ